MRGQIFISYAHADQRYLRLFENRLKEKYDLWTDRKIGLGDGWKESIDGAIQKSFAVLLILTPKSSESKYVTYEWSYALGLGRRVITVVIEETKDVHPRLENLQWIQFLDRISDDWDWDRLIAALHEEELAFRRTAGTGISMMLLQDGITKFQKKEYLNALPSLKEAVGFAPEHELDDIHYQLALTYYRLWQAYRKLDDLAKVEDHLAEALEYHGDHPPADVMLNELYGKVEAHLEQARASNKDHAPTLAMLGDLYRRQAGAFEKSDPVQWEHLLEKAKVHFDDALALQPHVLDENKESVYASLGGVLKRIGRIEEAIAAYHKATEYRGTSYPYNNLGLLYMHKKETEKMRADFRLVSYLAANKINQQDTIDAWAFNDLLVAQIVLEQLDNAQATLETILAIPPSYALHRLLDTLTIDMAELPGASPDALAFIAKAVQAVQTRLA